MTDDQQRAKEFLERFQRLEDTPPELVLMSCDRVLEAITAALRAAPAGFVVVAHRLITGDPRRKWQWVQGEPSEGVRRQAQESGWEIELGYAAARPQGVKQ